MSGADTIARAVARSIRNGEINDVYRCNEGIAYVAELDRKGSGFEKNLAAHMSDAAVMRARTTLPGTPRTKGAV